MKSNILAIIITLIYLGLSYVFSKNALHMFQQNRYEFKRYTNWLFSKRNIHFSFILIYVILVCLINYFAHRYNTRMVIILLVTILFAVGYILREDKKEYIKPLVLTSRVKRQIAVFSILLTAIIFVLVRYTRLSFAMIGITSVYLPYLLIYLVAILTLPVENAIKKKYENEARDILKGYEHLIKVGITGSYGKTTTKNVVKDIIGEKFYTLITPASYNTPMGITRTIRENFKPIYESFICEMGADHVGEITYLMDFVKPKYGIVTSIGPQHLNTFGSLKNIIHEKMQEIELLPSDGVGIINVDNEYINDYKIKNTCKIIRVGIKNKDADLVAYDLKYSSEGTTFKIKLGKRATTFKTVLLGEHNVMNILCGIALGLELGMSNNEIAKAVSGIKQVSHRLEIKKINGFTFVDNAFNSNPVGCRRSLDVLSLMPGKRVIVTPGLIDLGKEENDDNYVFGQYMKDKADFVILVGEKNSAYIKKGLIDSEYDMNNCLTVSSVKEAFAYIYGHFKPTDTILLENDLPDAFLY